MANKIKSAEEFLKTKNIYVFDGKEGFVQTNFDIIKKSLIEFAKLHVEQALKNAVQNAELIKYTDSFGDPDKYLNQDSILNSYPLDLIK